MPHVLDDTDILECASASAADDAPPALPLELPESAPGRSRFLTLLRRLIASAPRLRTHPQKHGIPGTPRFTTSLDLLARQYPDSHLWIMAVVG
jgi:hypothetical protein